MEKPDEYTPAYLRVRLTPDLNRAIWAESDARGVGLASLVREILERELLPTEPNYALSAEMCTADLIKMTRSLRVDKNLTQRQLASRIKNERTGRPVSVQAISKAESDEVGSEMNGLRVKIIQELSNRSLIGPYWKFEDEPS